MIDIQKINWKLFIENPAAADPDAFFKVFNTWIPDSPEIFVDVADYKHVHDGPLIALVGHHEDYWLDAGGGRPGILYNRRTRTEGTNEKKLTDSLRSLLKTCRRIEQDPEFGGRVKFNTREILMTINDRGTAPNTKETYEEVKPALEKILTRAYANTPSLKHLDNKRQRFSVQITAEKPAPLDTLLQRLTTGA